MISSTGRVAQASTDGPAPQQALTAPPRVGVAVIVSRFPKLTETFILREIDALEKSGLPVTLVPLIRNRETPIHRQARPWLRRALWSSWASGETLRGSWRALRRRPGRCASAAARILAGSLTSPALLARNLALLPKAFYLAEALEARGISHVHAHFATHPTTVAWMIHRIAGIPYSFTAHAHDIFVDTRLLSLKVRDTKLVRAISRHNVEYLRRVAPEVPAETFRVIRLGVDPDVAGAAASSGRRDAEETGSLRLLCVAALRPYKGFEVLVDACARLETAGVRVRCELVGEGPARQALLGRVRRHGLEGSVRLAGAATQEEVAAHLADADLFVHPSVVAPDGQMDGIPVALMEAMAASLPVVASDLSGIPELVTDGVDGLLVPPGDVEALAAAIESLAGDAAQRRRLGESARMKVSREYDLTANTERLAAALTELAGPPAPWATWALRDLAPGAGLRAGDRIGIGSTWRGADAFGAEVLVAGEQGLRRLFLKVHRDRPGSTRPARRRAVHEHAVLSHLRTTFAGHRDLVVPAALGCSGDAVLMIRCPGRPLIDLLREGRYGPGAAADRADAALEGAGRWLAKLHAAPPLQQSRAVSLEGLVEGLRADLEKIERAESRAPGSLGALADALASAATIDDAEHLARPVTCHGDYWSGNILVEGDRIAVIDFEGARPGVGAYDLAYFLLHLEELRTTPGRQRAWRRRFLRGYGLPVAVPVLRLARAAVAARLWASASSRGAPGIPLRRLQRRLRTAGEWRP